MNELKNLSLKEQEHFDKLVDATGETWWGNTTLAGKKRLERRAKILGEYIQQFHHPLVLEIGCGTGVLSEFLLKELPNLHFVGCDVSSKAIESASARCSLYPKASFQVCDATNAKYQDNSFDCIIGNSILHHLPLNDVLRECRRLLKPNGMIIFFEPNMMNPQIAIEKNFHFIGKRFGNTPDETAFFRWTLKMSLEKAGFQNVVATPFDFLHPAVPDNYIKFASKVGSLLEKIPIVNEIAGSLLINARKP